MGKHTNTGTCEKCQDILNRYKDFNEDLRIWFETLQAKVPEVHISCAGRGKIEQQEAFYRGASKAMYGESAHNYNCAIDLFFLVHGETSIYPKSWFERIIKPEIELNPWLTWGANWKSFPELPHVEIANWKHLKDERIVSLVE